MISEAFKENVYELKYADFPVKDLTCEHCDKNQSPEKQFRLSPTECGQKTSCIGWVCSFCDEMNLTPDDLSVLDAEILT